MGKVWTKLLDTERKEHSAWRIAYKTIILRFQKIRTLGPMPMVFCRLSSVLCLLLSAIALRHGNKQNFAN